MRSASLLSIFTIMEKLGQKIYIIGAGVSGLVAAKVLEEKGYYPIILEKTDRVGGRIKTDIVEKYYFLTLKCNNNNSFF